MCYKYPWSPTISKYLSKKEQSYRSIKGWLSQKRGQPKPKQKMQPHRRNPNQSLPMGRSDKLGDTWRCERMADTLHNIKKIQQSKACTCNISETKDRKRIASISTNKSMLALSNRCYECQNPHELLVRGSAKMCWKETVKEGLKELHMSAKRGNTKAKYLITLAYHHQGGDARRTVVTLMTELKKLLTADKMECVFCYWRLDRS